jgi:CO dehydrogenase maturation factor
MKVLICGKGGSGKSTLSALVAIALKNRGYTVLLVDADESNYGLHRLLGVSHPVSLLDSLGGKKGFREMTASAFPQTLDAVPFKERIHINDIPGNCITESDGIKLMVVGKIHHFGEGCACPMGMLSKMVLSKLEFKENEIVLVDTSAGIEHFGRRVDGECDMIIGVVDPCFESFVLSQQMTEMAKTAGVEIFFVLNKFDEKTKETMNKNINLDKVIAEIPYMHTVFIHNLEGRELKTSFSEIDPICQRIEDFKKNV